MWFSNQSRAPKRSPLTVTRVNSSCFVRALTTPPPVSTRGQFGRITETRPVQAKVRVAVTDRRVCSNVQYYGEVCEVFFDFEKSWVGKSHRKSKNNGHSNFNIWTLSCVYQFIFFCFQSLRRVTHADVQVRTRLQSGLYPANLQFDDPATASIMLRTCTMLARL